MEDVTSNIRPMQQLVLGSYNCRGLSNSFKRDYVSSLLDSCDFLFIREHWLSDTQLAQLNFIRRCILRLEFLVLAIVCCRVDLMAAVHFLGDVI